MFAVNGINNQITVVTSSINEENSHDSPSQAQTNIVGVKPMNSHQVSQCHVQPNALEQEAPNSQSSSALGRNSEGRHLAYLSSNPSMSQTTVVVADQVGRHAVPVTGSRISRCRLFCVISILVTVVASCSIAFYFGQQKDANCLIKGFFSSFIINIPVVCCGFSRRRRCCCC
jgi:hypothetical protein